MHQNHAVILWQFNYCKNSSIVLVPSWQGYSTITICRNPRQTCGSKKPWLDRAIKNSNLVTNSSPGNSNHEGMRENGCDDDNRLVIKIHDTIDPLRESDCTNDLLRRCRNQVERYRTTIIVIFRKWKKVGQLPTNQLPICNSRTFYSFCCFILVAYGGCLIHA